PCNHFLEEPCFFTVARILHYLPNQSTQSFRTQLVDFDELTHTMMCNSCSDTRLVISDGDRNHGDTLSEGFECRIEPCMRDTQRRAFQYLNLSRTPHHEHLTRNRSHVLGRDVPPHREHDLSSRKVLDCSQNRTVHMAQTIHQGPQRGIDERCARQLLPWKGYRLSPLVVVKRTRIVKLGRPGGAGKIELSRCLGDDGHFGRR